MRRSHSGLPIGLAGDSLGQQIIRRLQRLRVAAPIGRAAWRPRTLGTLAVRLRRGLRLGRVALQPAREGYAGLAPAEVWRGQPRSAPPIARSEPAPGPALSVADEAPAAELPPLTGRPSWLSRAPAPRAPTGSVRAPSGPREGPMGQGERGRQAPAAQSRRRAAPEPLRAEPVGETPWRGVTELPARPRAEPSVPAAAPEQETPRPSPTVAGPPVPAAPAIGPTRTTGEPPSPPAQVPGPERPPQREREAAPVSWAPLRPPRSSPRPAARAQAGQGARPGTSGTWPAPDQVQRAEDSEARFPAVPGREEPPEAAGRLVPPREPRKRRPAPRPVEPLPAPQEPAPQAEAPARASVEVPTRPTTPPPSGTPLRVGGARPLAQVIRRLPLSAPARRAHAAPEPYRTPPEPVSPPLPGPSAAGGPPGPRAVPPPATTGPAQPPPGRLPAGLPSQAAAGPPEAWPALPLMVQRVPEPGRPRPVRQAAPAGEELPGGHEALADTAWPDRVAVEQPPALQRAEAGQEATPGAAGAAASTPAAAGPAAPEASAPPVDVDALARQVYQILCHRLRVEQERARGRSG